MAELPSGLRRKAPADPALRSAARPVKEGSESESAPFVWSVSGIQRRLRGDLERVFSTVFVGGEISSLQLHGVSGHAYFTLKDDQAQLRCVMWKEHVQRLRFRLENGLEVIIRGRLTVFERSGQLQMTVTGADRQGDGAMEEAFRLLAEKLKREGLTAPERKRKIPLLPRAVGVVTSRHGAALRDVLRTAIRRDPFTRLVISPTAVQGEAAAPEIARAIQRLDALQACDVILVVRGGGSREDLWAFNTEVVARAIVAASVPVVTGVGHETDTSIADLVSDLSCSTPTAATESVVPVRAEIRARFAQLTNRLRRGLTAEIAVERQTLLRLERRLEAQDPVAIIRRRAQTLDELVGRAERCLRIALGKRQQSLTRLERRLTRLEPRARLASMAARLQIFRARQDHAMGRSVEHHRQTLMVLIGRLESLSPLGVLARGYAIVERQDRSVVRRSQEVQPGERLEVRLADGRISVRVEPPALDAVPPGDEEVGP
ncbi:MAG: exodeoxyribonuclease VII large subunit [Myxococcota bacterium]